MDISDFQQPIAAKHVPYIVRLVATATVELELTRFRGSPAFFVDDRRRQGESELTQGWADSQLLFPAARSTRSRANLIGSSSTPMFGVMWWALSILRYAHTAPGILGWRDLCSCKSKCDMVDVREGERPPAPDGSR